MNDKNEVNVLDELNKGCSMGIDAIGYILDKVKNREFKKVLEIQLNDYKQISKEIKKLYPDYSDKKPHETSTMNKIMTFYGIEMKTMTDESDSKLAELLLKGTNMGIIEGRRLLNHKDTEKDIHSLISEYVKMQEKACEELKKYL